MALLFESLAADAVVAVLTLVAFLYWFFTNNFDYWEKHGAPILKPVPVFGNFRNRLLFRKSLGEVTQDLYRQADGMPLFGTWIVKRPVLHLRDPEIVKRVLVKDFAHFHDRGMRVDEKRNPLSAHLFNLGGARWKALRHRLTPTFTSGKMRMMFVLMQECVRELVAFMDKEVRAGDGLVEFKELLAKFTTDIIGSCAFGLQCNSMRDPNSEFRTMGRKVFTPSALGSAGIILDTLAPSVGRLLNLRFPDEDVSDFFLKAVKDTVEHRERSGERRNDFLQLLIDLKNKGSLEEDEHATKASANGIPPAKDDIPDIELSHELLAAQAFVFFLAGFETSSTAMSFALHELSVNRDVQAKLRAELDRVLAASGGELSYDAIKKMEYLDMVVNESLRKYPPVPVLMRECTKPYVEPTTGVRLEEGTRVHVPVYALHHDPTYYPEPHLFRPERFSPEESATRPSCVFLPFGEGPRICIGMRFGLVQAKLGLAALLSRFEVEPSGRTPHPLPLDPRAFVTACMGGIWLRVRPRNSVSGSVAAGGP